MWEKIFFMREEKNRTLKSYRQRNCNGPVISSKEIEHDGSCHFLSELTYILSNLLNTVVLINMHQEIVDW